MKKRYILKTAGIILLALGLVTTSAGFDFSEISGNGIPTINKGNVAYAVVPEADEEVIPDTTLRRVLRTIVNYTVNKGELAPEFYQFLRNNEYDPYQTDITTLGTVGGVNLANFRNTPINLNNLDAYNGEINLAPYDDISALTGINALTGVTSVVLPAKLGSADMTAIPEGLFSGMGSLKEVIMPASITSIGSNAFNGCSSLETIKTYTRTYDATTEKYIYTITGDDRCVDLSTITAIGDSAFNGAVVGTSSIKFGTGLTAIGESAFSGSQVSELQNFSNTSITEIKTETYSGCTNLEEIICPDTVTTIGKSAFSSCGNTLRTIEFPVQASAGTNFIQGCTNSNLTINLTLGSDKTKVWDVPSGYNVDLNARAFSGITGNKTIKQVDGELVKDPVAFSATFSESKVTVTGGSNEVDPPTKLRLSANTSGDQAGAVVPMTVEYPIRIIKTHIDPETLNFNDDKFRLDGKETGNIIYDEGKTPVLYVDGSEKNIGKELILAAEAESLNDSFPGMINDTSEWTVVSGNALSFIAGSTVETPSDTAFTTKGTFTVNQEGTSKVRVSFDNGEASKPYIELDVVVEEGIDELNVYLESVGRDFSKPTNIQMPVGQEDKVLLDVSMDAVSIESSNSAVVYATDSGTSKGSIKAEGTGSANVTVSSRSNPEINHVISITVKEHSEDVEPTYVTVKADDTTSAGSAYVGENSSYTAECLPTYAVQGVDWSVSPEGCAVITPEEGTLGAVLTPSSIPEGGKLTITAKAKKGEKTGEYSVNVKVRTTALEFKLPYLVANTTLPAKALSVSSDPNQQGGIVRSPENSSDDIKFTSSDNSVLVIGTGPTGTDFNKETVTITGNNSLYFRGLKEGSATLTAEISDTVTTEVTVYVITNKITRINYYMKEIGSGHPMQGTNASLTIPQGSSDQIIPSYEYQKTSGEKIDFATYTSDNTDVATVGTDGKITAKSPGEATITIVPASGNTEAKRTLTVTVVSSGTVIPPTFIDIEPSDNKTINVVAGESKQITAKCLPSYSKQGVEWILGDTEGKIATLTNISDKTATLSGISKNTTSLVAMSPVNPSSGNVYSDTYAVVVSEKASPDIEPITSLACTDPNLTLQKGSSSVMKLIKTPSNSTDPITYVSSNTKVATVDSTGKITAVSLGDAQITATSKLGRASAICNVTVVKSDAEKKEEEIQGVTDPKLPKLTIKKPVAGKKSITVKWKKLSSKQQKKVKKIEIWVATDKKFTKGRIIKTTGKSKSSYKVKKLGKKKTYWVKVRTIKKVNGVKYVSKWSKSKKIKTK